MDAPESHVESALARAADAIAVVDSRRSADGTWPRDAVTGERVHYAMEEVGAPSRWNTLRALRIVKWFRG